MTDIFQQRYYKINKLYLSTIGLWPYQSRRQKYFRLTFIVVVGALRIPPQVIAAVKFRYDPEVIAESTVPLIMDVAFICKFLNMIVISDKMLQIFQRMEVDWVLMNQQPDINVLRSYAEKGRQYTIMYTVVIWLTTILYDGRPLVPRFIDFMKLTNETLPKVLPFPADFYGLDRNTFYYYILACEYISIAVCNTVMIVADTTFIIQVQHACGMFAVVGHQLKCMVKNIRGEYANYSKPALDPTFRHLTICIKKHSDVIKFGEILEASYTRVFLITVGVNLLGISIIGVQTVLMMIMKPKQAISYVACVFAFIGHLLLLSFFSQRLMDHSQQIGESLCQTEWYKTSVTTQKLLNLVIMRTRVPCQLTAGKIMTMSMKNFAGILKTSISYFTVIRSMQ